jgi:hypothetical protein
MVRTSTDNPGHPEDRSLVDYVLAPLIPGTDEGKTVRASAIASWGEGIGDGVVIPVVMSACEFKALGGTLDGTTFPTAPGYIYLHGDGPDHGCPTSPSGLKLPGGFGWIDSSNCQSVPVKVGDWIGSDNGNSNPCSKQQFAAWQNKTVLVPLYDDTRGSGSHGEYHIVGFASFKILGYDLKNGGTWGAISSCPGTSGNSGKCLYGEFSHNSPDIGTPGTSGGGINYGLSVITMIG